MKRSSLKASKNCLVINNMPLSWGGKTSEEKLSKAKIIIVLYCILYYVLKTINWEPLLCYLRLHAEMEFSVLWFTSVHTVLVDHIRNCKKYQSFRLLLKQFSVCCWGKEGLYRHLNFTFWRDLCWLNEVLELKVLYNKYSNLSGLNLIIGFCWNFPHLTIFLTIAV